MSVAASIMIAVSLGMLVLGALLALVRLALGPTPLDRAIAIDVVSAAVVGVIVALIAWQGRTDLMVLLIIFTLTAFFSTVTVARYSSSKLVQKQAQEAAGQAAPKEGEANDS